MISAQKQRRRGACNVPSSTAVQAKTTTKVLEEEEQGEKVPSLVLPATHKSRKCPV